MQIGESRGQKIGLTINLALSILIALLCLMPVIYILSTSLSGKDAILSGKVSLLPIDFTIDSYIYVAKDASFIRSMIISIIRTIASIALQMTLVIMAAYPLSQSRYRFSMRQFYVWFFVITILFSGGLVPMYMQVSNLHLINTFWALILPLSVPVFNVVLLQNFMKALPEAISEAAFIDGCGHWKTLLSVVLPLCKPSLATLILFSGVATWNEFYHGMLFIDKPDLWPLQTYLRTIVVEVDMSKMSDMDDIANRVATVGANSAKIFLAMLPILLIYPSIQRFFVTGLVYGSVKE